MADKNHHVADLGALLAAGDSSDGVGGASPIDLGGVPSRWSMLRLAPKATWIAPNTSTERSVLVLEGIATVRVDDWRYSAASGHLVVAAPGATLEAVNDGKTPFAALFHGAAADEAAAVDADV